MERRKIFYIEICVGEQKLARQIIGKRGEKLFGGMHYRKRSEESL